MPDGTGVMGGEVVTLPAPAPAGLVAVGGPYSIQGENPISGSVQLSLEFESSSYCGAVGGSTKIYHYNGSGWDALTTSLNEEWHVAAAAINQWGIYAVFAQPNPQVVFSDVPSGSTFYDYINWITCHGIASGYADGTFRPNNNATRGQISKMVSLAYQWRLDPPPAPGLGLGDVAVGQGGGKGQTDPDPFQWRLSIPADITLLPMCCQAQRSSSTSKQPTERVWSQATHAAAQVSHAIPTTAPTSTPPATSPEAK